MGEKKAAPAADAAPVVDGKGPYGFLIDFMMGGLSAGVS